MTATSNNKESSMDFSDFDDLEEKKEEKVTKEKNNSDDEFDLQKELEAKFDELFGPVDED